tara:strand:+ start:1023 stop:3263 length:2241 start_codon:yes stop_codon:yes gene_type:complete
MKIESIIGEILTERKKVTKQMWDYKWSLDIPAGSKWEKNYDRRLDALLTVFKDPDKAENHVERKWHSLPSAASGMIAEEDASLAQYIKKEDEVNEAEFIHIGKDAHAIKLAIKDVEKKARLKANRDKPLEYAQLSLNKIMLSKVLGREKLGREHQAAWKKLKKAYKLKESVNEAKDNLYLQLHKKYADQIKGLKAKKIKKLTDLVSVQRWAMEDEHGTPGHDHKKMSKQFDHERKLFKQYMAGDKTVSINEGQPVFQTTPNELAYIDFKKWAYKNRKTLKNIIKKAIDDGRDPGTDTFLALRQIWLSWAKKNAKEWSRIPNKDAAGSKFGRALAVMMKKDNLVISRSTNKLTDLNEIRKGDFVDSMGEIGSVNKLKGQVAYVKFDSRPGTFHPMLASSLTKTGKKHKGKDLYTEGLDESMIGIQTKANFKPNSLKGALEKAGIKGFQMNRLSVTMTALKLDKKDFEKAKKIIDTLPTAKIQMAKESVNEAGFDNFKQYISKLAKEMGDKDLLKSLNNSSALKKMFDRDLDYKKFTDKEVTSMDGKQLHKKIKYDKRFREAVTNESVEYIKNKFKVGDTIKLLRDTWKVIKINFKPGKSYKDSFTFVNGKQVPIKAPPTNKDAVGYKLDNGGETAFYYCYKANSGKTIMKLAIKGFNESFMEEGLWDNIRKKKERGESPAKPGDKDYPDSKSWDKAKNEGTKEDLLKAIPDNYNITKLAGDIADIIKDAYGSHNYKAFLDRLKRLLK